jgi:hypothetical protein
MVSQDNWDKTKWLIKEMEEMVVQDHFPLTQLLQVQGFLMYVVCTYPSINPYVKGLHLTINSWQLLRGTDGFKLRGKKLKNGLTWGLDRDMPCGQTKDEPEEGGPHVLLMALCGSCAEEPPLEVKPVQKFIHNLTYLTRLMEADAPPRQLYRARHAAALFVIGNASGKAKGMVVVSQYGIDYKFGVWSQHWCGKLLNVREAKNFTDWFKRLTAKLAIITAKQLKTLNESGALANHKMFILTDNSAFEGLYYKGHSTSRELNNIVFRLYKAQ